MTDLLNLGGSTRAAASGIDNEPKALVVDVLNEIISYVKQSRPTRTDGKATQGFVYSQLRVGQMVAPIDFDRPWTPIGGSGSTSGSTSGGTSGSTSTAPAQPAGVATGAAPASQPPANPNEANLKRALQAAFNTTELVDTMLVVTNDGTLETYSGGGRRLSITYEQLLNAMEAPAAPPRTPQEQAAIDSATKVLWNPDGTPTTAYRNYKSNQMAYAMAVAQYTIAQNKVLADPAQADSWPILAAPYQTQVDQAWDQWKSQGADQIEGALATVESLGVPLEQGMIEKARKIMAAWSLNFAGVPEAIPYSYCLPSQWAEIEADNIGWTQFTSDSSRYSSHYAQHGYSLNTGTWRGDSSSTSGEAGVGIFGFGFSGSYSHSDQSASADYSQSSSNGTQFHNDASDLSISLEYGLVEIVRPWLLTDLFRMRNWYLRGEDAGVVSSGDITSQVGKEQPLLPMLPTHFLVVRNVKISSSSWGSDGQTLSSMFGDQSSSSSSSSNSVSGSVDVPVFGPFSMSAGASHSDSHYQGQFSDESGSSYSNDYGSHFDGQTLEIRGAQIVAWLSEVIPASPPMADPSKATSTGSTGTTGSTGSTGTTGTTGSTGTTSGQNG